MINVLNIIKGTMADGEGIRNSVYLAGCLHRCPGCHNPQSWDINGGTPAAIPDLVAELVEPGVGVTISGGDPFYQRDGLLELLKQLKTHGVNVWVYTGFTYEELERLCPEHLRYIDVLVDGPYMRDLPESERQCGSTNQRIIYLSNGKIQNIL